MKRGKYVLSGALVAVAVLLLSMLSGCTAEDDGYPEPTSAFYVNDYANVLSEETEQLILNRGAALAEKTNAQVVVLTVTSLNGEAIEEYALNLGREWGIGDKEDNTGVLLLLAVEEREAHIAVGYGLEGRLPDSKAGRFLDEYAIPHFREDDFDTGVCETYVALVNEVYTEFGLESEADSGYVPIDQLQAQDDDEDVLSLVGSVILLVVLFGFIGFSAVGRRRGWPIFLMMNNHHRRPPRGGGGFGGGFSSGGSGFHGGGGSFGGGGASRGF